MVQENNIIRIGSASLHCLSSAEAGIYLDPIAAQDPFGYHKIHLLVVNGQNPDAFTGKRLAACGLGLLESVGADFAVEQIDHGKGKKWFVDHQKPA